MKFLRLGEGGAELPCVLDSNGMARDISSVVNDITPETVPGLLEALEGMSLSELPVIEQTGSRVGAPLSRPSNIFCIGLNYSDHAKEAGMPIPDEPILFNKAVSAYCGPNDPIYHSETMSKLDWEVELGIVIGRHAFRVSPVQALDHVFGFTLVNDVSERAWQLEKGGQWVKGKSFPNFCPTGPFLVTGDEIANAKALAMWLDVNDNRMQVGNTDTMIFKPATIISYLSQFMRLQPGDLICTGTPPGVGMGQKPPLYLKVGDRVSLGIEGLGQQNQTVMPI